MESASLSIQVRRDPSGALATINGEIFAIPNRGTIYETALRALEIYAEDQAEDAEEEGIEALWAAAQAAQDALTAAGALYDRFALSASALEVYRANVRRWTRMAVDVESAFRARVGY